MRLLFYGRGNEADLPDRLIAALDGAATMRHTYAAVLVGVPAAMDAQGTAQLKALLARIGPDLPVCRYRQWTGEFASASAVAAVMAVSCIESGCVPGALVGGDDIQLQPAERLLVLGTGPCLTAMEFFRP